MKKMLMVIMVITIVVSASFQAFGLTDAEINQINQIDLMINGKVIPQKAGYGTPFIDDNGRTMMPLRWSCEAMGANVNWENKTKKITITKDNIKIELVEGSYYIKVNGKVSEMDTFSVNIGGRVYIPIRFCAEPLGFEVIYQFNKGQIKTSNKTHIVSLTDKTIDQEAEAELNVSEDGVVISGVANPEAKGFDMSQNKYLVSFMKKYEETDYVIYAGGISYSPFHYPSSHPTISTGVDQSQNEIWIEVINFDKNKERDVLLAQLKAITGDANEIYNNFVEMWDSPGTPQETIKNFNFGTLKKAGDTNYMFRVDGGRLNLIIKY